MITRRKLFQTAAAASVLSAPRLSRAQPGKTFRYIPQADLGALDPHWTTAYVTLIHGFLVFDTLYGVDERFQPHPQMVAGHVVEDDGRRWTLTLRDGLKFHDGEPVRGRDVVASVKRWGARDSFGRELLAVTDELSAPSDKTVVFRLKKPFPLLPAALGKPAAAMPAIMPERLALTDPGAQVPEIIGSGPFRFRRDQWMSGSRVVYEKFDGYVPRDGSPSFTSGPKIAHLDRVEWRVIPDAATAAAVMLANEADFWDTINSDFVPRFERARNLTVVASAIPLSSLMRFNCLHPPFDNPAIRRALLGAVDQSLFLTAAAGADERNWRAGVGYFNSASPMANAAGLEALTSPRDPARVKRELLAAGYDRTRVVVLDPIDIAGTHAQAQLGAELLGQVGMNVDLQTIDWGALVQRRASQESPSRGGWNVFFSGLTGVGGFDPANNFALRGNGRAAWFGWPDSPRLEELRQAWFDAPDPATQRAACAQIQLQAFGDVPHIPLGDYSFFHACRRNVSGFSRAFAQFYNVQIN
jgi:peptide/nickel transport system substrate-binding protein